MMAFGLMAACNGGPESIDIQGHRGCRGHMPENTVAGFIRALDMGVNTLEMDVVISRDGQVLLSHEPFLSHEICLTAEGKEISAEEEYTYNLYQMDYDSIRRCDCGTKVHPRFPVQEKMPAVKPLLSEVIRAAEAHARATGRALPLYNIETKCAPQGDTIYHPVPAEFVELLVKVIDTEGIAERVTIQSFDPRSLQVAHQRYPNLHLALLIENEFDAEENLRSLGFTPQIYSPAFELVDEALVALCRSKDMKLIPWTLNEEADIRRMLDLGVDGIISDYPDRVIQAVKQRAE
ncbi:MAG: glycerophosphodiester phosphodiesterase [Bacteroidetes bacterium]|nr:MAG: glycerophosphodiester phosphodiesterase [Bacteroidota bacterium]